MQLKVDIAKCAGCRACEMACAGKHYKMFSPELSRIRILKMEETGADIPIACKQCAKPACVKSCPVNALSKNEETGAVELKQEVCIGCGVCVDVCPFGAAALSPHGVAMICDLCGGDPQCVQVCSLKAITVQNRDEVLEKKREALAGKSAETLKKKWNIS